MFTFSWQNFKKLVLDILFPPICLACERHLDENELSLHICAKCLGRLIVNDSLFCVVCKSRLPNNTKICHQKAAARLAAAVSYDQPIIKKIIWLLKFQDIQAVRPAIRDILTRYLASLDFDFSDYTIIPVPLHPKRLRERGFNQAEIISGFASEALRLPVISDIITRAQHTPPQTKMRDRAQRLTNIIGSFKIASDQAEKIKSKNLLIVDDVFTTGATTLEVTRVLKSAGARNIIILTLAKGK